ncbi:MAG: formate dehydrogenase subunit gamma [Dehalococcoidales bacterium]|nr:formate dehydrogenase subunit gamma [Dehalococcoidales bacterium]
MEQEVERYRKPTRILHWVHAGAFVILFLTGLVLFIPQLGFLAEDSWTRVFHRIASVIFIVAPLIYIPLNWKATLRGIKNAFSWGGADIGWLKAAPRYYFLADEKGMPPQEHMNTGQKMWWSMVIVFGLIFVITGLIMWAFKTVAPAALLQWMVLIHDVAFIATGCMLFVHIYLSVAHPLMRPLRTGAWNSMARGKVSVEYAKSHHSKWYDEVSKSVEEKS